MDLSSIISSIKRNRMLWLCGLAVFSVLVVLSFTVGADWDSGYWLLKPQMWLPYVFSTGLFFAGPWSNPGLLIATIFCWAIASFVIVTTIASMTNNLNPASRKRILWIDVFFTLAIAVILGYSSFKPIFAFAIFNNNHLHALLSWPFISLFAILLWIQTIELGYLPTLFKTGINARNRVVLFCIAITFISAIVLGFFGFHLWKTDDPWQTTAVTTIYIFLTFWAIVIMLTYELVISKINIIAYLGIYTALTALSFTIGIQGFSAALGIYRILNPTLWLPYYGYGLYGGIDKLLWGPGYVPFLFTLIYWGIISFILLALGKLFYRDFINRKRVEFINE